MLTAFALAAATLAPLQDGDGFRAPAVVAGRLLLPDGAPALDAALLLHARGKPPAPWKDATAVPDAEGRFRIELVPPRDHALELRAELAGHAPSLWSWESLALGDEIDLGEVAFQPAGTLVGSIIGKDGELRVNGWWIQAEARTAPGDGRDPVLAWGGVDPASGEFRFEGLSPGPARVTARHLTGFETVPLTVEVVARLETSIELLHEGPDPERQLLVHVSPARYHDADAFRPRTTLVAPDGSMVVRRGGGTQFFRDLEPGEYALRVDDPQHETWSQSSVWPGRSVNVRLRGAARLALEVVAAESGAPLTDFELAIVFHEYSNVPQEIPATHAAGAVDGLVPVNQTLIVRAPGRPATSLVVEGLTAGETLRRRVEVPRGRRVEGRVVDATGAPAADVQVEWTPGTVAGYAGRGWIPDLPSTAAVVRTDAAGRFAFTALGPGAHTIRARPSPWLWCDRTTEPGTDDLSLELVLPAAGYVAGHVDLPEGFDLRTVEVDFAGQDFDFHGPGFRNYDGGAMQPDGRFRFGPLPVGEIRMRALIWEGLGERGRPRGSGRYSTELPVAIEAGATTDLDWDLWLELPGTAEVRVSLDSAPFQDAGRVTFVTAAGERAAGPASLRWSTEVYERALAPGDWHVLVIASGDAWQWRSPEPFTIEPGKTTELEVDVPFVARAVHCVDPDTGAPLSRAWIAAWTGDVADRPGVTTARTDRRGNVRLVLPNGPVRFSRGDDQRSRRPVVPPAPALVLADWLEGATPIELALPPLER